MGFESFNPITNTGGIFIAICLYLAGFALTLLLMLAQKLIELSNSYIKIRAKKIL
jgi:hypothetical protein